MNKFLEMFQHAATIHMLVGVGIISGLCAYLGVFVVLRRAELAGAVLVQMSPMGIALALFLSGLMTSDAFKPVRFSPPLFALVLTMVAAVLIALPHRERRPRYKTTVALAWLAVGALAVTVLASLAIVGAASFVHARAEMIYLLFGNTVTITTGGVVGLLVLACSMGLIHWLFYKEFLFVSFDPDMALALGKRVRLWNTALFLTIGVTIALAIRAAGALVVFSSLVLPPATALLLGRNLRAAFAISVITGVLGGLVGITISYVFNLPSGPTVMVVNLALLLVAFAARRRP
jgi:ABC-type Mn2+/Zn2+ transport system permease subunit